ncbi:MAG: hypothetical protein ACLFUJ_04860 [Phycisphaerae bacterium]
MIVWAILLLVLSLGLGALGYPKAAKTSRTAGLVLLGLVAAMVIGAIVLFLVILGILF